MKDSNEKLSRMEIYHLLETSEKLSEQNQYDEYTVKVNYKLIIAGQRNSKYFRRLARAYSSLGKTKSAIKVYEKILDKFPDDDEAKKLCEFKQS